MRKLAKSLSGHDKGQYYVIINEDAEYVYLVDGRTKTIGKPKKKNRKHIQTIQNLPEEVSALLEEETLLDTNVKRALKLWNRSDDRINLH